MNPSLREPFISGERNDINMKPKYLRGWFAKEMGNSSVSGEQIDGSCGRDPRTVRAQHYSDYSPKRLKDIYEEANLRVME